MSDVGCRTMLGDPTVTSGAYLKSLLFVLVDWLYNVILKNILNFSFSEQILKMCHF